MAGSDAALLLRDFVNTVDVERKIEELTTPARLAGWLTERGLVPAGTLASGTDLTTAITLREGLRQIMFSHHGTGSPPRPPGLDEVLAGLQLRVSVRGPPALVPLGDDTAAGLGGLAIAIMETVADGSWPRLKVCRMESCRWAFLDTSKNRSRSWCSMRVCGNRTKTRSYRDRRRVASA